MYLSKLVPDTTAHAFRRDFADIHQMHRTVMSAFPDESGDAPARQHHGVLWRLDSGRTGYLLYVQSRTKPSWDDLTSSYLTAPAQVRDLSPVVDALEPGRTLAFRLVANPTKRLAPTAPRQGQRRRDARFALHKPEDQIAWLLKQAHRYGFSIPTGAYNKPDLAPSPCPRLTGHQTTDQRRTITVDPVRYDGHLTITDPTALAHALHAGIGPAKAYGCGLLTLAPPRRA